MIISASYRTDIPAFYGEWFVNRLNAGYCKVANPYSRQVNPVDLRRDAVEGFVFWTKNLGPFLDKLPLIRDRGYPFVVQYSINGYPRALEFSVVRTHSAIRHMRLVSEEYGARTAVWRYDPIVFSSITPPDFHRRNFEQLARALEGATDEVVISFAQIYKKTLRNMNWGARKFGFTWSDPGSSEKRALAAELAEISKAHGMQLSICSQREYLSAGIKEAACVDVQRLSDLAGRRIGAKLRGNRPDCGCFEARDIGEYDTCPHGCVYCYAVLNRDLARDRYKRHDPQGETLFAPEDNPHAADGGSETEDPAQQLSLPW